MCVVMASTFGARSLAAVVMPLTLAVVAALVTIRRTDRPAMTRTPPTNGFVGESRVVEIDFETDTPMAGVVRDELGEGVSAAVGRIQTTVGGEPVRYEITYEERGVHELGPVHLAVTDVLGLATRQFTYPARDSVIGYPRVYDLAGATRSELAMLAGGAIDREREEFDRLREYESGDSLRDVHWKSSAKRPEDDLVVKEFVADDEVGTVTLAVEATRGNADRVAEAAASLAVHFLAMGIAVGIRFPDGTSLEPDAGADHRTRLLEHLARVGWGDLPTGEREGTDVYVRADDSAVVVRVNGEETTFESLTDATTTARTDAGPRGERPDPASTTGVTP